MTTDRIGQSMMKLLITLYVIFLASPPMSGRVSAESPVAGEHPVRKESPKQTIAVQLESGDFVVFNSLGELAEDQIKDLKVAWWWSQDRPPVRSHSLQTSFATKALGSQRTRGFLIFWTPGKTT